MAAWLGERGASSFSGDYIAAADPHIAAPLVGNREEHAVRMGKRRDLPAAHNGNASSY